MRTRLFLALACAASAYRCGTEIRCGQGTVLTGKSCVPETQAECGDGTFLKDGKCVPTTNLSCGTDTRREGDACVSTLGCGAGTLRRDNACVAEADLPTADVMEAAENNNPGFPDATPGLPATFEFPAAGDSVILGGTIDAPSDLDGDGTAEGDWDAFDFTVSSGGAFARVSSHDPSRAHVMVLITENPYPSSGPGYQRLAYGVDGGGADRPIYLPAGDYRLFVSDLANLGNFPVGGEEFAYRVSLERIAEPTARALESTPQDLTALDRFTLDLPANSVVSVAGSPAGGAWLVGYLTRGGTTEVLWTAAGGGIQFVTGVGGAGVQAELLIDYVVGVDLGYTLTVDATATPMTVSAAAPATADGDAGPSDVKKFKYTLPAGTFGSAALEFTDIFISAKLDLYAGGEDPVASASGYGFFGPTILNHYSLLGGDYVLVVSRAGGDPVPDAFTVSVSVALPVKIGSVDAATTGQETVTSADLGPFATDDDKLFLTVGAKAGQNLDVTITPKDSNFDPWLELYGVSAGRVGNKIDSGFEGDPEDGTLENIPVDGDMAFIVGVYSGSGPNAKVDVQVTASVPPTP